VRIHVVLVHQAPISGSGTSASRVDVAQLTASLNVAIQVQPIVSLSDLVECLIDSKVSHGRSSMYFRQYFLHLTAGNVCLSRFGFSVSGLPVAL
jgi:hypothetical protein